MKWVQRVMEKNNKLIKRNLAAFFLLGSLLLLLACIDSPAPVTVIFSVVIGIALLLLLFNFIGVFNYLYRDVPNAARSIKQKFRAAVLWMWTIGLVAYCIARILGIIGAHKNGINPILVRDINLMALSIQNHFLNGIFYFIGMALWMALLAAVILLASYWSYSKSFEHFRGIAAIFLMLLIFITERFAVKFISAAGINALGGITAIFESIGEYAVLAVFAFEDLLLVIGIIMDLALVKVWIKKN